MKGIHDQLRAFECIPWYTGLNFINILCTAFTRIDPESVRIQSNPQYLFTLLGSMCVKAACRILMKSTPCAGYPLNSRTLYLQICFFAIWGPLTFVVYLSVNYFLQAGFKYTFCATANIEDLVRRNLKNSLNLSLSQFTLAA